MPRKNKRNGNPRKTHNNLDARVAEWDRSPKLSKAGSGLVYHKPGSNTK